MKIIKKFPYVISRPGYYKVKPGTYYINTNAIIINADDVFLDLSGSNIVHRVDFDTTHNGIYFNNKTNVHIKGGYFRNFMYGILGDSHFNTNTVTVESVVIENCFFRGIRLYGHVITVKNNIIRSISGTLVFPDAYCMGIEVDGVVTVVGNIIQEVYGMNIGEGVGISVTENGNGSVIAKNIITNAFVRNSHTYGIWVGGDYTKNSLIQDNMVSSFYHGLTVSRVGGSYRGNTMAQCKTPYLITSTNFIDLGGNVCA